MYLESVILAGLSTLAEPDSMLLVMSAAYSFVSCSLHSSSQDMNRYISHHTQRSMVRKKSWAEEPNQGHHLHNSPTVCQYHSCTWWHTRAWMHREWCRLGVLYLYTRKGNDSSYHLNYLHEKGSMPHRIPTACLCRSHLWMSTSGNLSQPSCSGVAGCLDR